MDADRQAPGRPVPRFGWLGLAACASVALLLAGCESSRAPGSSSLAAVLIQRSSVSAIHEATLKVFEKNGYTLVRDSETAPVFEHEGTKRDKRLYGNWGGDVWVRAEIKIQPYGAAHLLRCDAFAVRNHGDRLSEDSQKLSSISAGPYKDLLLEIQRQCAARS